MKKLISYPLLFVLLIFTACKTQEIQQKSEPDILEKSLLWSITNDELKDTSFLFGTVHIIPEEDFFWPEGMLGAIAGSDEIIMEIDLDDMYDLGKQMALLPKLIMKDGIGLKDLYTEEEYTIVKGHFADMGIPFFIMEKLKPMFLIVFASGDFEMGQDFEQGGFKSYEMEIYEKAQESDIEVGGLETIEYQVSVFDSIPYERQADMLLDAIQTAGEEDDAMEQMFEIYKQQDLDAMVLSMDEDEDIKDFEDILNHNRNQNWIPLIEERIKERSCFFAVGAGHLGGDKGVIRLLRKEGYKVEAYK